MNYNTTTGQGICQPIIITPPYLREIRDISRFPASHMKTLWCHLFILKKNNETEQQEDPGTFRLFHFKCMDQLSVWIVGMWINDVWLHEQDTALKHDKPAFFFSSHFVKIPGCISDLLSLPFCLTLSYTLLTLSPIDPSPMLTITHTHMHTQWSTLTDPHSDPHPSPSLSLLYLYISPSIGYTCNLATEQSEDPPLPAHSSDCWTWQPIKWRRGSDDSQSSSCYCWESPCALHLFDPTCGQRSEHVHAHIWRNCALAAWITCTHTLTNQERSQG